MTKTMTKIMMTKMLHPLIWNREEQRKTEVFVRVMLDTEMELRAWRLEY